MTVLALWGGIPILLLIGLGRLLLAIVARLLIIITTLATTTAAQALDRLRNNAEA